MKVLCINGKFNRLEHALKRFPCNPPVEGNEYEVTFVGKCRCGCEIELYKISSISENIGWPTNHFIPLSEIDETEFERNYQKELV